MDAIVHGEFAENTFRKNFTLSEAVAIKRALEPIEKAEAKERMLAGKPLEKFSKGNGRALDKVAKVVGKHRTTIAKAEAIVAAAEAEPGKVQPAARRYGQNRPCERCLRRLKYQQAELIRAEPPPLPRRGPYRVGTCDMPWPYEVDDDDPSHRGAWPFPTMSLADVCAMPVSSIMHDDFDPLVLDDQFSYASRLQRCLMHGDFQKHATILTWIRTAWATGIGCAAKPNTASWPFAASRSSLSPTRQHGSMRQMRGHSVKPIEFYDLVESFCPAPRYADLFSRYRHNDKWDCHDEAPPPVMEAAQ